MFADAPPSPDADVFAARVTARLDRNWGFRQALIGGLGVVGGLIGGWQFLGAGVLAQVAAGVSRTSATVQHFTAGGGSFGAAARNVLDAASAGATLDVRVLVMSAALAAVAGGLFLTRAIREI